MRKEMDTKFRSKQERAEQIMEELTSTGSYFNKDHAMMIGSNHEVLVTERRTGALVAYSSTRADFDDSVAEFVYDYFI